MTGPNVLPVEGSTAHLTHIWPKKGLRMDEERKLRREKDNDAEHEKQGFRTRRRKIIKTYLSLVWRRS